MFVERFDILQSPPNRSRFRDASVFEPLISISEPHRRARPQARHLPVRVESTYREQLKDSWRFEQASEPLIEGIGGLYLSSCL